MTAPAIAPTRVYVDTEFTTLDPPDEAELLSVGLTTADGRTCYLEVLDDELRNRCSTFVRTQVLPQFGRVAGARAASYGELADRAAAFLIGIGDCELRYDEAIDRRLLSHALQGAAVWPQLAQQLVWLNVAQESSTNQAQAAIDAYWAEAASWSPLERHHALADARALCAGVEADLREEGRAGRRNEA